MNCLRYTSEWNYWPDNIAQILQNILSEKLGFYDIRTQRQSMQRWWRYKRISQFY
jgi:hypothetical protein